MPSVALSPPPSGVSFMPYDVYAHHGRQVMQEHNDRLKEILGIPTLSPVRLQPITATAAHNNTGPVGIIGAGMAGLYTALMLEELGISYQIFEARSRVGGRLFTYKFPDSTGAPYNYFDIGAMRYPNVTAMTRLFDLFGTPVLNTPDLALKSKLRPYYFTGTGNYTAFLSYNGNSARKNGIPPGDFFQANDVIKDTDGAPYIAVGPDAIIDDAFHPFLVGLYNDLQNGGNEGWKYMMQFDHHSVRSYLYSEYIPSDKLNLPKKHLTTDIINWLDTRAIPQGEFDGSLTDYILDVVSFGWQPDASAVTDWFLIDGGSEVLSQTIYKYLSKKHPNGGVSLNTRVTSVAFNEKDGYVDVVTDSTGHHRFSHVISTPSLPAMRTIELKNAGLSRLQWSALRQLNYAAGVKIGMQFKTAWWTTGHERNGNKLGIIGGQSGTDTPIQHVVYPSFGDALHGKTPTLIASYSLVEEAMRMSSWIKDHTENSIIVEPSNDPIVALVIRELAKVHNVEEDFLRGQLIATKPWSWNNDPYSMGAFGYFGPGDFKNLYPSLNSPAAKGHLHFAGEALSPRHGWVVGALDTAWRAVREMLLFPPFQNHEKVFFEKFGVNQEWVRDPSRTPVRIPEAPVDLVWENLVLSHPELVN